MRDWTTLGMAARSDGAAEFLVSRLVLGRDGTNIPDDNVAALAKLVQEVGNRLPRLTFVEAENLAGYLDLDDQKEIERQLAQLQADDADTYRRCALRWSIESGSLREFMRYVGAVYAVLYVAGHLLVEDAA